MKLWAVYSALSNNNKKKKSGQILDTEHLKEHSKCCFFEPLLTDGNDGRAERIIKETASDAVAAAAAPGAGAAASLTFSLEPVPTRLARYRNPWQNLLFRIDELSE